MYAMKKFNLLLSRNDCYVLEKMCSYHPPFFLTPALPKEKTALLLFPSPSLSDS